MMDVRLHIAGYPDSDAEERAELGLDLREELRSREFEAAPTETDTPASAKGTALEWAQLVVTLAGSLPALIVVLRSWSGRNAGASITVEIAGDQLKISGGSSDEREQLIADWIDRHAGD
jgi:hypothetical protein